MDLNSTGKRDFQMANAPEYTAFSVMVFLIMLSSLTSNFLVFFVLAKKSELLSASSNKFLLNLTLANFFLSLTVLPFVFMSSLQGKWTHGKVWCQSNGFLNVLFSCVAILTATCLSYDRYHCILNPLSYTVTLSNGKSNSLIALTWLFSLFVAILPLTGWGIYGFNRSTSCCTVLWGNPMSSGFSILFAILLLFLPMIVMSWAYHHIIKAAKRQARIGQIAVLPASLRTSVSSDFSRVSNFTGMKAVRTTLFVLGTLALCWGPYVIAILVESSQVKVPHEVQIVNVLLSFLTTSLYPLIYGFRLRLIRREVKRLLYSILFCCNNNRVRPLSNGEAGFIVPPPNQFRNRSVSDGLVGAVEFESGQTVPEVLCPCMPIIMEETTRQRGTDLTELSLVGSFRTSFSLPGQIAEKE